MNRMQSPCDSGRHFAPFMVMKSAIKTKSNQKQSFREHSAAGFVFICGCMETMVGGTVCDSPLV